MFFHFDQSADGCKKGDRRVTSAIYATSIHSKRDQETCL